MDSVVRNNWPTQTITDANVAQLMRALRLRDCMAYGLDTGAAMAMP